MEGGSTTGETDFASEVGNSVEETILGVCDIVLQDTGDGGNNLSCGLSSNREKGRIHSHPYS